MCYAVKVGGRDVSHVDRRHQLDFIMRKRDMTTNHHKVSMFLYMPMDYVHDANNMFRLHIGPNVVITFPAYFQDILCPPTKY